MNNQEPKVGDTVIEDRYSSRVQGHISLISDRSTPVQFVVMVDWLPKNVHDPELVTLNANEWSKTQNAWVLAKKPGQDELCFNATNRQIGRIWGTDEDAEEAIVLWAADLGVLTDLFVALDERDDDQEDPTGAVRVSFHDMAYLKAGRWWNVLPHSEST